MTTDGRTAPEGAGTFVSLTRRQILRLGGTSVAATAAAVAMPATAAGAAEPVRARRARRPIPVVPGEVYPFRLGDIDIAVIDDGYSVLPVPYYAVGAPEGAAEALLAEAGLPTDAVYNRSLPMYVRTHGDVVLYDAGFGSEILPGEGGKLAANLAAAGLRRDDVETVVISHASSDHIGGLLDPDGHLAFPDARYLIARAEWDYWNAGAPGWPYDPYTLEFFLGTIRKVFPRISGRVQLLDADREVVPGVQTLNAPGHTPGHLGLSLRSGRERLLNIGDACAHHVLSLRHPEWAFGADIDPALSYRTRLRLLEEATDRRTWLYGYHFPFPGIGEVTRRADAGYDIAMLPAR